MIGGLGQQVTGMRVHDFRPGFDGWILLPPAGKHVFQPPGHPAVEVVARMVHGPLRAGRAAPRLRGGHEAGPGVHHDQPGFAQIRFLESKSQRGVGLVQIADAHDDLPLAIGRPWRSTTTGHRPWVAA